MVQLPEGVGFLDFMVPGSRRLQEASVAGLREARIVIWAKHGLLARSDDGPLKAVDLIEYAETGARYEGLNAQTGSPARGLTDGELRAVIEAFGVRTSLYRPRRQLPPQGVRPGQADNGRAGHRGRRLRARRRHGPERPANCSPRHGRASGRGREGEAAPG
ncbi:hypothetical protein [Streptomyces sp. NPDC006997]|uniref:hypothetical protein n=1 Tax=Streptomyces sp. NPDC006997 TaxID=3155356 RepID=UPI0033EBEAC0